MNKVKIITDSCSDLSGELLTKYDIDYAKMTTVCEGVQQEASCFGNITALRSCTTK